MSPPAVTGILSRAQTGHRQQFHMASLNYLHTRWISVARYNRDLLHKIIIPICQRKPFVGSSIIFCASYSLCSPAVNTSLTTQSPAPKARIPKAFVCLYDSGDRYQAVAVRENMAAGMLPMGYAKCHTHGPIFYDSEGTQTTCRARCLIVPFTLALGTTSDQQRW
jgi:hypothetical protein